MSNGKQLEALVAFIEKTLLPKGFDVKTNERVYNDDGVQIAEFDLEITGQVGSTNFYWLIECRDRPSGGAAPVSWVEQLVGRRDRFGFNKVTAVSTTGFAAGAAEFAQRSGIELRTVNTVAPEDFRWLLLREMPLTRCSAELHHATFFALEPESEDRRIALSQVLASVQPEAAFLKSNQTGEVGTPAQAFLAAVELGNMFDSVGPNVDSRKVQLSVTYPDENHYTISTPLGDIRIGEIHFYGELKVELTLVPLITTARYQHVNEKGTISQLAALAPQELLGHQYALEMHRMGDDGETHVLFRRV